MDLATVAGLILGLSAVAVGFVLEGGHLSSIFQFPAILLVLGGTLGASMVTTSIETIRNIPNLLRIAFSQCPRDPESTVDEIVRIAEHARRDGVLGLEKDLAQIKDPFLHKAIELVIDATEVTALSSMLENICTRPLAEALGERPIPRPLFKTWR